MSDIGKDFIFIHIFKCAGNSIKQVLRQHDPSTWSIGAHTDAADILLEHKRRGKEDDFFCKYKFVVVRNPYNWLGSTYDYIKRSSGHNYSAKMKTMDINAFIDWYIDEAMQRPVKEGQNKYLTQKQFITEDRDIYGKVIVDAILERENLKTQWPRVAFKLGLKSPELPNRNVSPNHYPEHRERFNNRALSRIQETFGPDFEFFNYQK